MAVPLDTIRAFHNAFRKDMKAMDLAALAAAEGRAVAETVAERYAFFNEALILHAVGEEEFVFTAMEKAAPLVAEAYQRDHRGLDELGEMLGKAVAGNDRLVTARVTSAYRYFLDVHLNKEEAHLYRIFDERVPMPDQWAVIGNMSRKASPEIMPKLIGWIFPLLGSVDRENLVRNFQHLMPPPVFAGATQLIKRAVGDGWADLAARIPELG